MINFSFSLSNRIKFLTEKSTKWLGCFNELNSQPIGWISQKISYFGFNNCQLNNQIDLKIL